MTNVYLQALTMQGAILRSSLFPIPAPLNEFRPTHQLLYHPFGQLRCRLQWMKLQVGLASSRSLGGDCRRRPWSSSHSLDRPTLLRHWICSCQPQSGDSTGHSTWSRWSDAAARAGYAMTARAAVTDVPVYPITHRRIFTEEPTTTTTLQTITSPFFLWAFCSFWLRDVD